LTGAIAAPAVISVAQAATHAPLDAGDITGAPDDWTWPENRIDQWGISDKDVAGLRRAEEAFRFRREWQPAPVTAA